MRVHRIVWHVVVLLALLAGQQVALVHAISHATWPPPRGGGGSEDPGAPPRRSRACAVPAVRAPRRRRCHRAYPCWLPPAALAPEALPRRSGHTRAHPSSPSARARRRRRSESSLSCRARSGRMTGAGAPSIRIQRSVLLMEHRKPIGARPRVGVGVLPACRTHRPPPTSTRSARKSKQSSRTTRSASRHLEQRLKQAEQAAQQAQRSGAPRGEQAQASAQRAEDKPGAGRARAGCCRRVRPEPLQSRHLPHPARRLSEYNTDPNPRVGHRLPSRRRTTSRSTRFQSG